MGQNTAVKVIARGGYPGLLFDAVCLLAPAVILDWLSLEWVVAIALSFVAWLFVRRR